MKRRHPLTLLEIVIVMVLLGFLLTGIFHAFHQSLKKNIEYRELKQSFLQFELFEQQLKHLLTQTKKVGVASHPEAKGLALLIQFTTNVDIEWDRTADLEGMLYLNTEKQLCFASWSNTGKSRINILLDRVDQITYRFFDPQKKEYREDWPSKTEGLPPFLTVELIWKGEKIPITFLPPHSKEQISYYGVP